jgi:4-amino-4-deoxy-L-arabinose transferase-like glycosyltransferase
MTRSMADLATATNPAQSSSRPDFRIWLGVLVVAQLVLWTLLPWSLSRSLPLDVVSDGLAWGHEWQWGYYKHPPLPSWTVEAFFDAFGDIGPFLLSQICIAGTYLFVFLLGREMMPVRWAAVGTLLLVGVYYFSIPTPEFNHNVAQMPAWAAACFCYFRAWKTGRKRWWLALGFVAGLGLLCKYATAALLLVMLVHFLATRRWKGFSFVGPWIAATVCLLTISEHVFWLFRNGFPTLHYAAARAGSASGVGERFLVPFKFIAAQAFDIAPAVALAWIGCLRPAKTEFRGNGNMQFLLWMTLGPPLVAVLGALATGMGLRDMWGAPMWNLTGLLIVLSAGEGRQTAAPNRLAAGSAALFTLGLAGFALANVFVPQFENRPSRLQWPDREMARDFEAVWRTEFHRPLHIVASDAWLGGLVAMRANPRPSVWIDTDYRKAPWITPDAVARDGALVIWRVRSGQGIPRAFAGVKGMQILGQKSFVWPDTPKAPPLQVGYGIVSPTTR